MVKMNFTDNQTAFEYALYMRAASYFDKAECKSQLVERKMFVQYKEQKLSSQYQMEDICIDSMDSLAKAVPSDFFHQNMTVFLVKRTADAPLEIVFKNNNYCIKFTASYAGRKSQINTKISKAA